MQIFILLNKFYKILDYISFSCSFFYSLMQNFLNFLQSLSHLSLESPSIDKVFFSLALQTLLQSLFHSYKVASSITIITLA